MSLKLLAQLGARPSTLLRRSVLSSSSRSYTLNTGSTTLPITTALTNVCTLGKFAKFDETVSLHVLVTLDPRKPNQNIRTKISLPHGTGSKTKILVMTDDQSMKDAALAQGAIVTEGSVAEAVKTIQDGDQSLLAGVDRLITSPNDMRTLASLGRILGPRGLMPNPKLGTVTSDIPTAVSNAMKGEVIVRVNKEGGIYTPIGKVSMGYTSLKANARSVLESISSNKPTDAKGVKSGAAFWKSASVSRTMGGWGCMVETGTVDPSSSKYFRGGVEGDKLESDEDVA